jgi:hypothetical protein
MDVNGDGFRGKMGNIDNNAGYAVERCVRCGSSQRGKY